MANETITGKIFTLKDPTGTYNRFPRTVMEAVYGLIPFLQNQFSSLADIYMPIEGITESKPLQEFVYRKTAATIKAKSLTLDRIYGKSLAWSQLVQNGDFSDGTNNWFANGGTISASSGVLSYTVTTVGSYDYDNLIAQYNAPLLGGHKYYISLVIKAAHNKNVKLYLIAVPGTGSNPELVLGSTGSGSWTQLSKIVSPSSSFLSHEGQFQIGLAATSGNGYSVGDVDQIRYVHIHDLTLIYGSEIDGMTDAQILAKFESEYPGYHEAGNKLISNDAESIETVGFNQWDEEWVNGYVDSTTGNVVTNTSTTIASVNLIPVSTGTYYFRSNTALAYITRYDANKAVVDQVTVNSRNRELSIGDNIKYIRFHSDSYGTTYNHDICINLSDPAKNGTYEPYRKSVMQLGLGSFQVRDGQGNVITITGGLKSAGSVRDEIVGNKYIQRVGRVDLGTLTWEGGGSENKNFYAGIVNRKHVTGNIISSKYAYVGGVSGWGSFNSTVVGLYCKNGDVDEIVGVRSESAYQTTTAFAAAMSGVMLDYELATPIEYELVSPLVPTVKAGITEARISPNSDGLSAPMVADMTYDAQANNDSASAQYALTAGRLLNSHKLWGQDFDGTEDVAGALTGVTNINSVLAFDNGVPKINNNVVWHAGNSNLSTVDWSCKKLSIPENGGIYAASGTTGLIYGYDSSNGSTNHMASFAMIPDDDSNDAWQVRGKGGTYSTAYVTVLHGGNVGIGNTSPSYKLDVSGTFRATGAAYLDSTVRIGGSSGATLTYVAANTGININKGFYSDTYITAGSASASSDARLKDSITPVLNAIKTIMALKPSQWIWNEKHFLNGQRGAGLVAQDVEKVLPFAVTHDTEYLALNYNVFHAYEIAGLQNHEERIKALEAENAELRRRLGA